MARPYTDSPSTQHTASEYPSQVSSMDSRAWSASTGATSNRTPTTPEDAEYWLRYKAPPGALRSRTQKKTILNSPIYDAPPSRTLTSSHGKLHKRVSSASSMQGSAVPPSMPTESYHPSNIASRSQASTPSLYDGLNSPPPAMTKTKSVSKAKVKIRPLLRKLSSQENTSIDLSRSAAENEGLGIYEASDISREATHDHPSTRFYHNRTTSANSHVSIATTSSVHRPTQYAQPMRQTPRPYTPPSARSFHDSLHESEPYNATDRVTLSEGYQPSPRYRQPSPHGIPLSYAPLPAMQRIPPPIHIRTGSSSHLTSSSQTNLPGTPSSLRLQTDNLFTPDSMPITARSSLESAFRLRSRTNTATDPVAKVQELRADFREKEKAKDLRYRQAEQKALDKEVKRQEKRDESERRKSEGKERKRARSNATSEKSVPLSANEPDLPTTMISQPGSEYIRSDEHHRQRAGTAGSATKAVNSKWMLFCFRLKTMWLKLRRKMSSSR